MNRPSFLMIGALVICALQAGLTWGLRRQPFLPSPPKLASFPLQLAAWTQVQEETVDPDALAMLGPDDFTARVYQSADPDEQAELFIAYYKSQLRGKSAHDPKVCLPGAGWNPLESHASEIPLDKAGNSFPAIYYRIEKNRTERVVLYWFQTLGGVYTREQQLRVHRILDAISQNRTDMALVRIIVPVSSKGLAAADNDAKELARAVYLRMLTYFTTKETAAKSGL